MDKIRDMPDSDHDEERLTVESGVAIVVTDIWTTGASTGSPMN